MLNEYLAQVFCETKKKSRKLRRKFLIRDVRNLFVWWSLTFLTREDGVTNWLPSSSLLFSLAACSQFFRNTSPFSGSTVQLDCTCLPQVHAPETHAGSVCRTVGVTTHEGRWTGPRLVSAPLPTGLPHAAFLRHFVLRHFQTTLLVFWLVPVPFSAVIVVVCHKMLLAETLVVLLPDQQPSSLCVKVFEVWTALWAFAWFWC